MNRLHQQFDNVEGAHPPTDLLGGPLPTNRDVITGEKMVQGEVDEKASSITPDGEEPTEDEKRTLRHIAEHLPLSAWLVAAVELSERFTYYGMSGLFQNYIQRPLDGSEGRGALGMGHQGATGLSTFFQFWCYGKLGGARPDTHHGT